MLQTQDAPSVGSRFAGFTLLELAVVGAVLVLAAIAMPAYQNYTLRAQVTEGLITADGLKIPVAETYLKTSAWPRKIDTSRLPMLESSHCVSDKYVDRGTIFVTYGKSANAKLADHTLSVRPTINEVGEIIWTCGLGRVQGFDPPTGAAAPANTTVPAQQLPTSCRASND